VWLTALQSTPLTAHPFACCLGAGAIHAPYKFFDRHINTIRQRSGGSTAAEQAAEQAAGQQQQGQGQQQGQDQQPPLYVVCRRGNDSQRAVARLRDLGIAHAVDVVGGMEGWAREVDPGFPTY